MAGEEETSSTEAPPGAARGPSEHSQQHQHRATGVNIILTHCPKPNEIFVLVQEGDVSARRANITLEFLRTWNPLCQLFLPPEQL